VEVLDDEDDEEDEAQVLAVEGEDGQQYVVLEVIQLQVMLTSEMLNVREPLYLFTIKHLSRTEMEPNKQWL
jgi:hypothetical protein